MLIPAKKFFKSGKSWTANRNTCKNKGDDLVSMETIEEWEYVNSEIQKISLSNENEWHIGLKKEGNWKWVSGKPLQLTSGKKTSHLMMTELCSNIKELSVRI